MDNSLFFTPSKTLSHNIKHRKRMCVCVWCVCYCSKASSRRARQFMVGILWPDSHVQLKMHVTRILLQQHSRRCDAAHDGGFALQSTFFGALQKRASPENLTWSDKARKTFDGPRSPVPQGEWATLNSRMHAKHVYQAAPLLWASVHTPLILRRERAHRSFLDVRAPSDRTGPCRPREGDSHWQRLYIQHESNWPIAKKGYLVKQYWTCQQQHQVDRNYNRNIFTTREQLTHSQKWLLG